MWYWSLCQKAKKTSQAHLCNIKERYCHYLMTGRFHMFHQPILKNKNPKIINWNTRLLLLKHAADGMSVNSTPHTHYKIILGLKASPLLFFLFCFSTFTIIFSPAATICKQHTEKGRSSSYHGQGLAEGVDGHLIGGVWSGDHRRLEGVCRQWSSTETEIKNTVRTCKSF